MSLPTTNEGIGFVTYDDSISTRTDLLNKQLNDLSGNATARTFCENAF